LTAEAPTCRVTSAKPPIADGIAAVGKYAGWCQIQKFRLLTVRRPADKAQCADLPPDRRAVSAL